MILPILFAATTFCNPMSIPDMPLGAYCRDQPNVRGSSCAVANSRWAYSVPNGAACAVPEIEGVVRAAEMVVVSAPRGETAERSDAAEGRAAGTSAGRAAGGLRLASYFAKYGLKGGALMAARIMLAS